jgi:hypothetical protein
VALSYYFKVLSIRTLINQIIRERSHTTATSSNQTFSLSMQIFTISRRELSTLVRAGRQVTLRSNLLAREPALFTVVVVGKAIKATSTSSALTMLTVAILAIHSWSLVPLSTLFVVLGSITALELVGSELALLVQRRIVHVVRSSLVATSEALWASLLVLPLLTMYFLASLMLMTRFRLRFSLLITGTFS